MRPCTVIIPVYNTDLGYLKYCFHSIQAQTLKPTVIVVDDHSNEFTRKYLEKYVSRFSNWSLIRHRFRNRGVAHARNTALKVANTEFIAICDSDDIWEPDKLETQINGMSESDGVSICGTRLQYRQSANYILAERQTSVFNLNAVKYLSNFIDSSSVRRIPYVKLIRFNASFCGSNVVFRRDVLMRTGGFNPKLNGADEWDALLNVAAIADVKIEPKVLCTYVRHAGSYSTTKLERLRRVCEEIIYKHRCNLSDTERILLQSVNTAQWAESFERATHVSDTPFPIVQYSG